MRKLYRIWRTSTALFFVGSAVLALLVAFFYGVVAVAFGLPFWSPGLGIPARFEAFTKSLAGLMTEQEAYCQACGAEISAGDRYCKRCGAEQAI